MAKSNGNVIASATQAANPALANFPTNGGSCFDNVGAILADKKKERLFSIWYERNYFVYKAINRNKNYYSIYVLIQLYE